MKKTLSIIALVLAITVSLIAGTMSYYYTEINDLAEGSVVAKEFILLEEGEDSFKKDVKIAPGEEIEWTFAVKNYDGPKISETAMDLVFTINLAATDDKDAIAPLQVCVGDKGLTDQAVTGSGTIEFKDAFQLQTGKGQTKTFKVTVSWPWETLEADGTINDADYAGADYGSTITVSVTGKQVKSDSGSQTVEP